MKTIMKTLVLVALVAVVFYGFEAFAADKAWQNAFNVMVKTFKNVRVLVYVVGAFGLIAIAVGGIMGKIAWSKLGYLAAGLAIVAAADLIINWATGFSKKDIDKSSDIQWTEDWGN